MGLSRARHTWYHVTVPVEVIGAGPRARERARQKVFFLVAASGLIVAAHVVDLLQASGPNLQALGIRIAWAALLLATAAFLSRGSRRAILLSSVVAAFGTSLLFLALLAATGGSRSPLFAFAFPLAIILPLFMDEFLWTGLASSALLLAGAWGLMIRDGASAVEQLGWGHAGAVTLLVAWLLGVSDLRTRRTADALARAREADLLRLAESERLAATGRLAAEVAHEVNNPLAAARASATFLREQLRDPDEETAAASEDLVGSLDRIARLVRGLGKDAGAEPKRQPPRP